MTSPRSHDILIAGAGPAGGACAITAARHGLRVLLIEASAFPREKVCGACLNPNSLPLLDRLGITDDLARCRRAPLDGVSFVSTAGRTVDVPFEDDARGLAVRRLDLDAALAAGAVRAGAEFLDATAIRGVSSGWEITTSSGTFRAPVLVAADGRNSTVARCLGLLPPARRDRVGMQAYIPLPPAWRHRVGLLLSPHGYAGLAPVDGDTLNLCLVSRPDRLGALRAEMRQRLDFAPPEAWRTMTPLARAPIRRTPLRFFAAGDAARVVEPLTGEGIYYALRGGELAAEAALALHRGGDPRAVSRRHARQQRALYRGRLWINRLARFAVEHPRAGDVWIRAGDVFPQLLARLTRRVMRQSPRGAF